MSLNNSFLPHSYGGDSSFSRDGKCLSQDHTYASSSAPVTEYLDRRGGLGNNAVNQLRGAEPELEYGTSPIAANQPFTSKPQHLLVNGSQSLGANNSISSLLPYSLSKTAAGNVSGTEQFSVPNPSYLQPTQIWSTRGLSADALRRGPQTPLMGASLNSFTPANSLNAMVQVPRYLPEKPMYMPFFPNRETFPPDNTGVFLPPWPRPSPESSKLTEGPPFEKTDMMKSLVNERSVPVDVEIIAGIPKGFFRGEKKWTCYRRNYFTLTCGFILSLCGLNGPIFISDHRSPLQMVQYFAMSISAKTSACSNQESEPRGLVQHTPKRSKDTESIPGRVRLVATPPNSLVSDADPRYAGYASQAHFGGGHASYETFAVPQHHSVPSSHTFERIQFQKATANNGKRRAQQQYFHVVVELLANVGPDEWVTIAIKQSERVVVRGRSPGHYKSGRRESTASMDPDAGAGGADGHAQGYNMQGMNMGHAQATNMDWPSSAGNNYQYGGHCTRSYYAYPTAISDKSSESTHTSPLLTTSTTDEVFLDPLRGTSNYGLCSIQQGYGNYITTGAGAGIDDQYQAEREISANFGSFSLGTGCVDPSYDLSFGGHLRPVLT